MIRRRIGYPTSPRAPLSLCGTAAWLWKTLALIDHTLVTQPISSFAFSVPGYVQSF